MMIPKFQAHSTSSGPAPAPSSGQAPSTGSGQAAATGSGQACIRLLVADDHSVVRRGLRQIVEDHADLCVACEAGDGAEVIEHVRGGACDAVILDLNMPGP